MTNVEDAKVKRDSNICTYLIENNAAFAGDIAFETLVAKIKADYALTVIAVSEDAEDNTGYSAEKTIAKIDAATLGSEYCASSQVKLDSLGNLSISQSLNSAITFYTTPSDIVATCRLQNAHDIMNTNLTLITPDYLKPAQLATFQTKINKFTSIRGTTSIVNNATPVKTKALSDAIKTGATNVLNIQKLAKKYIVTNPTFYNELQRNCKIPPIAVRHTTVIVTITNAANATPIEGVSGTLSKTRELGVGSPEGIVIYQNVSAGAAISTYAHAGFITGVQNIKIKRGKINNYTFALKAGTMTTELEAELTAQINAFKTAVAARKASKAAKAKASKEAKAAKLGIN